MDSTEWDKHLSSKLSLIGGMIFKSKIKALKYMLELSSPKSILEVGCGNGHLTEVLKRLNKNYTAIDYSRKAIEICQSKGLKAEQNDMFNLNSKYDLVISDGLLEHYLDFQRVVSKMCDLSNKYVLIIQPNHTELIIRFLLLMETIMRKRNPYEYNYQIQDYHCEFLNHKFYLRKIFPSFFGGYMIILYEKREE
jgi:2-polyprenyl-3-methyl-5-hydroxy-6-metoxy-1,4-benzoquinol methylase